MEENQELKYGVTTKGMQTLIYKNHEYILLRVTLQQIKHWRCRGYRSYQCKAIVHTNDDGIIKEPQKHTHDIMLEKISGNKAVAKMKKFMARPGMTPKLSMAAVLSEISQDTKMILPKTTSLSRTLQRSALKKNDLNVSPCNIHFEIPTEYMQYILYDSGIDDNERVIILGKPDLLNLLSSSDQWIADGTFNVVPKIFFQLYSINVQRENMALPCILALLPGKSPDIYIKMLNAVRNLLPQASPSCILMDFDRAAMDAFEIAFPAASISGCFYHLTQSVLRKISELGLKHVYENDNDQSLRILVKTICALSLLPPEEVEDYYLELVEKYADSSDVIDCFFVYFENTYIRGRQLPCGRRRSALFPIETWNHHNTMLDELARTFDCVEDWHFGLQSLFECSHPTIWKFLTGLVKEIELQYLQCTSGQRVPPNRKYRNLKTQLEHLVNNYDPRNKELFLSAVIQMF